MEGEYRNIHTAVGVSFHLSQGVNLFNENVNVILHIVFSYFLYFVSSFWRKKLIELKVNSSGGLLSF